MLPLPESQALRDTWLLLQCGNKSATFCFECSQYVLLLGGTSSVREPQNTQNVSERNTDKQHGWVQAETQLG